MKKIFIFSLLALFAYAAFRPPEGMTKFPVANIHFDVNTADGKVSATLKGKNVTLITGTQAEESHQDQ